MSDILSLILWAAYVAWVSTRMYYLDHALITPRLILVILGLIMLIIFTKKVYNGRNEGL